MSPEERLRAAFEARAQRVAVAPDALQVVRTRIAGRGRQRRRLAMTVASVGTALAAAVTAVVIGVVGGAPVAPNPTPPIATTGGQPTPSAGPTPSSGLGVTVPVYFVGHGAPVLYREYRKATVATDTMENRVAGAVALAVAGPALDPDYATWWPAAVGVRRVTLDGGVATVDLTGVSAGAAGGSLADPGVSRATVEQLIYTVTAVGVVGSTSTISGVRLLFDGAPRAALWGVPVAGTLTRADPSIQAALWLVSPQQGDVVTGTFTVQLVGTVYEAAARLRVREVDGRVRSDQSVLLDAGPPARGQATVTLTLPPGSYTIEVYAIGEPDGREIGLDGHQITVR